MKIDNLLNLNAHSALLANGGKVAGTVETIDDDVFRFSPGMP